MAGSITQLVFDGVSDGSVGVTLDILGAATRLVRAGVPELASVRSSPTTRIVSIDGQPVSTAAKRTLVVDGALNLRRLGAGDVLILPGLGMATPSELAAALERPDLVRARAVLSRAAARGVLLGASCSATFVLADAGVLDGAEATTTWWLGATFARRFPRVRLRQDRMVIRSGGVFTAGSAFAHADLVLAVLTHTVSPSLASLVAKYLVLDERASQARYMVMDHLRSAEPVVQALERFIGQNISRQLRVSQMARATATSARTLARKLDEALGVSPLHFAQRLRIAHALHLLETTHDSIETIASRVGYADPAAFRRIFRRQTGEAPNTRRRRSPTTLPMAVTKPARRVTRA
jgi:transcriptional regulator GlxA family with amidase domain